MQATARGFFLLSFLCKEKNCVFFFFSNSRSAKTRTSHDERPFVALFVLCLAPSQILGVGVLSNYSSISRRAGTAHEFFTCTAYAGTVVEAFDCGSHVWTYGSVSPGSLFFSVGAEEELLLRATNALACSTLSGVGANNLVNAIGVDAVDYVKTESEICSDGSHVCLNTGSQKLHTVVLGHADGCGNVCFDSSTCGWVGPSTSGVTVA
jgi:hypothetical protein